MKANSNYLTLTALLAAALSGLGQPLPPVITQQPTNQMPYIGSTVTFSVIATGAAPLSYQWVWDVGDLVPLLNQTNASLTLVNVQFANKGRYFVRVSNEGGTVASQLASLSVLPTDVVNLGDLELSFGVPTNLSALNSSAYEDDCSLSTDGLAFFFESDRPGGPDE